MSGHLRIDITVLMTTYDDSLRIGWTMRSGEYDLMAPAAVGEQMTCERSAP